jgi:hypothetical protein
LNNLTRRNACAVAVSLAAALSGAGCGPRLNVFVWTEEVMLNDGRIIVIQRKTTAKKWGFPEPREGAAVSFELKYEPMGVHWVGPPEKKLLSFDIIDGVAWLAVSGHRQTCEKLKRTDFRASFYKWQSGGWTEVRSDEYPLHTARYNLVDEYWGRASQDDTKRVITWIAKSVMSGLQNPPESIHQFFVSRSFYCSIFERI